MDATLRQIGCYEDRQWDGDVEYAVDIFLEGGEPDSNWEWLPWAVNEVIYVLKEYGFGEDLVADGVIGEKTKQALTNFLNAWPTEKQGWD